MVETENLQKLKETGAEILDVVDRYWHSHNIRYSLYAGTVLGAVRHKGFLQETNNQKQLIPGCIQLH